MLYEKIAGPAREAVHWTVQTAGRAVEGAYYGGAALVDRTGKAAASALDSFQAWMAEAMAPKPEAEPLPEEDSILSQPDMEPPKEILDPLVTDIIDRDGQEILTGGGVEVVYFNQTDEARKDQKYGSDPLGTHGCGPTAMAMAVSSLTEETIDPVDMAGLCVREGYWCKSHGSYHAIVSGVAESFGLQWESLDPKNVDEDELFLRLASGDVAVALMTKGHFTNGGHFILLRGVTLGGEILVADPASRERSLIPWDLSLILGELSSTRASGSPLWILSKPAE